MKKIVVVLLRRNALNAEELAVLRRKFDAGTEFEFCRIDPADCHEHARLCADLKPTLVVLPREKPIPSIAMEMGFDHVAITPGGVMKLTEINAEFDDYEYEVEPAAAPATTEPATKGIMVGDILISTSAAEKLGMK